MTAAMGENGVGRTLLDSFDELKLIVHRQLLESMDLDRASKLESAALNDECERRARSIVDVVAGRLEESDRIRLVSEVLDEMFGLGPLQPLMADDEISDILVNGPDKVFIERNGKLEQVPVSFRDEQHVMTVVQRIVRTSGRRLDETSPLVDTRLPDGSRVNAIIPPLALDGPVLSIRRFGRRNMSLEDLCNRNMMTESMVKFLAACTRARMNIIISGGSGAGKTTLLNALSAHVPESERIVSIEDAAELKLQQAHVVRLETRAPNIEGSGEITARVLVRNALRMRPDRILIGECRGSEAFDMLQAMNSGHEGSMTTIHANGPSDAFHRLEIMLCMAQMEVSVQYLREYVASAMDLVVQVQRLQDGTRRVMAIAEVMRNEDGSIGSKDIFRFKRHAGKGDVFETTGYVPGLLERLQAAGSDVTESDFVAAKTGMPI